MPRISLRKKLSNIEVRCFRCDVLNYIAIFGERYVSRIGELFGHKVCIADVIAARHAAELKLQIELCVKNSAVLNGKVQRVGGILINIDKKISLLLKK